MQYQKFQAKPVYIDPATHRKLIKKQKGCICFDSTAEYQLFQFLKRFNSNYSIAIHQNYYYGDNLKTNIDFKLNFTNRERYIKICDIFGLPIKNNSIWIEYKGILDNNFKNKLTTSGFKTVCDNTIFVSSELTGFSIFDKIQYRVISYPIYSFNLFKQFWRLK